VYHTILGEGWAVDWHKTRASCILATMNFTMRPKSLRQADKIIWLGVGLVLVLVCMDKAQQSEFGQYLEILGPISSGVAFLSLVLIVYGAVMRIRLSKQPTAYGPIIPTETAAELDVSNLASGVPDTVTDTRLAVGMGFLCTGSVTAITLIAIGWRDTVDQPGFAATLIVLLCGIGIYAITTYFLRRRTDRVDTKTMLTRFAQRNGFQVAFDTAARDTVVQHLKEIQYRTVIPYRRPRVSFCVQGVLHGRTVMMMSFMDRRFVGIISCSVSRPLQSLEFDTIRAEILQATPDAVDVTYSNHVIAVIFPDGLALDQVSMKHYAVMVSYIANVA